MLLFYIITCVLTWTIIIQGAFRAWSQGISYTADFLKTLDSNTYLLVSSQACRDLGLVRTATPNTDSHSHSSRKHNKRGSRGTARRLGYKGIKCCLINARSVVNKTTQIHDIVTENNVDIGLITETWLNKNDGKYHTILNELCPTGYKIISAPRNKRGGGLAFLYRECFRAKIIDIQSSVTSYEHISVAIEDDNHANSNIFVGVYRPPSKSQNVFLNELRAPDRSESNEWSAKCLWRL